MKKIICFCLALLSPVLARADLRPPPTVTTLNITSGTISGFIATASTITTLTSTNIVVSTLTPTFTVGQTNANASPVGDLNEIIISSSSDAAPLPAVSGNLIMVATMTVTAGCWAFDYVTEVKATNASTSITNVIITVTLTSGSFPSLAIPAQNSSGEIQIDFGMGADVPGNNKRVTVSGPQIHVCVSGSTTYYLGVDAIFAVSTASVAGGIMATRVH